MNKSEHKDNYYEDRINLYDYFQVIWKWKFIIVGIVILSVIVALLLSFRITRVYRVSASLSPGEIEEIDKETLKVEVVPVDRIENIVGFINGGNYNPKIFSTLKLKPFNLKFQAEQPGEAYIINVTYDTIDSAQGMGIVGELLNQIETSYSWKITTKIERFKETLNSTVFYINKIKLLKDAEKKMTSQVKMIDENTQSLMKQRDLLLSEGVEGDRIALLLYLNTIQQNIEYIANLNTALQTNRDNQGIQQRLLETSDRRLSNQLLVMEKLINKRDIEYYFSELISNYNPLLEKDLNIINLFEKLQNAEIEEQESDVKMIRVVQEPYVSPKPIKPKRARMVMISVVLSLFLGFFLALIIDFIKKNKAFSNQS